MCICFRSPLRPHDQWVLSLRTYSKIRPQKGLKEDRKKWLIWLICKAKWDKLFWTNKICFSFVCFVIRFVTRHSLSRSGVKATWDPTRLIRLIRPMTASRKSVALLIAWSTGTDLWLAFLRGFSEEFSVTSCGGVALMAAIPQELAWHHLLGNT